jgi:hypothetical protein
MPALRDLTTRLRSPVLLAAMVGGALLTWLICWSPFTKEEPSPDPVSLELNLTSPSPGTVGLRIDEGHGFATNHASGLLAEFQGGASAVPVRLRLPASRIHTLRLSFFGTPSVELENARIRSQSGSSIAELDWLQARALSGTRGELNGTRLALHLESGRFLSLDVTPPGGIIIPTGSEPWPVQVVITFLASAALLGLLQFALARRKPPRLERLLYGIRRSPALTLDSFP